MIGLDEIRTFVISSLTLDSNQFKKNITNSLFKEINSKLVQQ